MDSSGSLTQIRCVQVHCQPLSHLYSCCIMVSSKPMFFSISQLKLQYSGHAQQQCFKAIRCKVPFNYFKNISEQFLTKVYPTKTFKSLKIQYDATNQLAAVYLLTLVECRDFNRQCICNSCP